jgi:hypothetical protein
MWWGMSTLSGRNAADIGRLSAQTSISMPALANRGIPNCDHSSVRDRKIVHEVLARFDAGNGELRSALSRIAVQDVLLDATICGWYRQWCTNRL